MDDVLLGFALGLVVAVIGLVVAVWVTRTGAALDDKPR